MVLVVNNPPAGAGDAGVAGSIPGSGRSPGGGDSNLLQHFAWKTPWTEEPDGLPKSQTQLSTHSHMQYRDGGIIHHIYCKALHILFFQMILKQ